MSPFGMSAGEFPEDVTDRTYDIDTVFKNFDNHFQSKREVRRETAAGKAFVVEVRKQRRPFRDR